MTINTTANRAEFTGNDVTTDFSFPYYFLADADLVVIETVIATGVQTTKTLTTHYTVAGAGNPAGGTVTMLVAPASTVTLTIYRDPSATQGVDLVEGDPLPVETAVERPLDKLTMIVQRIKEVIGRSLRLPEGDTGFVDADMYLPAEVDRASKYLGFDVDGKPIATAGTTSIPVVSSFIETLLDDTSAAAARTTLGAGTAMAGANTDITSLNAPALGAATATTAAATDDSTKVATSALVRLILAAMPSGNCQVITASGTFTAEQAGDYLVIAIGGGGGGGGGGSVAAGGMAFGGHGGAGGLLAAAKVTLTAAQAVTVTIPAAANGGAAATDGSDGGDVTFGALLTATGGKRGRRGNGTLTVTDNQGGPAGGNGGGFGGGQGAAMAATNAAGNAGSDAVANSGGGGGGGSGTNQSSGGALTGGAGGKGGTGLVIVLW